MQHRFVTVFWLWLAGRLNLCSASWRSSSLDHDNSRYTFTRIGSIPVSLEGLTRRWVNRKRSQSKLHAERRVDPNNFHALNLPTVLQLNDADADEPRAVQLVSTRLRKRNKPRQESESTDIESSKEILTEDAICLSQPLIPTEVWERMTGTEFEDEALVDALARSGLEMCTQDENPFIQWKAHKDTEKILQEKDRMQALDEGKILVEVGKAKTDGFGCQLPIIRTQSIIPMSAEEMADLLMDSSRVKIYNKMSLGRKDIRSLNATTKIVQNLTQPPVAKSKMVSVTLMHARQLGEGDRDVLKTSSNNDYLVVSRAVPPLLEEELAGLPRNDILLGVNLLQHMGPDECMMTAVTHVYSPALPVMLARSMGVSSAINFIRDVRSVCEPVLS